MIDLKPPQYKSPILIFENVLSPLYCKQLINNITYTSKRDNIKIGTNSAKEQELLTLLEPINEIINQHYNVHCVQPTEVEFQKMEPLGEYKSTIENSESPHAENSVFVRDNWLRVHEYDFTCMFTLKTFQDAVPFDDQFEVLGGILEFPQHNFGIKPQQGSLTIFPSDMHFINLTTPIRFGTLERMKFHINTKPLYFYDPKKFPGKYADWFKNYQGS